MIKKNRIIIMIALVVIVLFEIIRAETNPLIRSEEEIKINLLKETPLGTAMEDVVRYIEARNKWKLESLDYNGGFLDQRRHPFEIVGERSIGVLIGEYRIYSDLYFTTSVTVFYGFNKKSELIDIWVWKVTDTI